MIKQFHFYLTSESFIHTLYSLLNSCFLGCHAMLPPKKLSFGGAYPKTTAEETALGTIAHRALYVIKLNLSQCYFPLDGDVVRSRKCKGEVLK